MIGTEDFARQRLDALIHAETQPRDRPPAVLFLCVHNAGREPLVTVAAVLIRYAPFGDDDGIMMRAVTDRMRTYERRLLGERSVLTGSSPSAERDGKEAAVISQLKRPGSGGLRGKFTGVRSCPDGHLLRL